MNATQSEPAVPKAKIREQPKFLLILAWSVPLIAAIVAGWLVCQNVQKTGPAITIQFLDGTGIRANQTILNYRGVHVGDVHSVWLTKDAQRVEVGARLDKSAENLAREGSLFWIVRPEVGAGGLHGLETIDSGPYIQVQPGSGREQKTFIGVEEPPVLNEPGGGLEIILTTPHLGSLTVGSPVYYRGVEAGSVRYFVLSKDSTAVNVHVIIETNYAPLVRTDSKFWNAGGINVDLKLFGINLSAESFKSLVIGGIAFATPSPPGPMVSSHETFPLCEKMEDKWLKWSPRITVTNASIKISHDSPSSLLMKSVNPGSKQ